MMAVMTPPRRDRGSLAALTLASTLACSSNAVVSTVVPDGSTSHEDPGASSDAPAVGATVSLCPSVNWARPDQPALVVGHGLDVVFLRADGTRNVVYRFAAELAPIELSRYGNFVAVIRQKHAED